MSGQAMSDRSSGHVVSRPAHPQARPAERQPKRDDSVITAVAADGRVSAARAAAVAEHLTDTDKALVDTLATVRLATGGQLQRLHFGATSADNRRAGRALKRLTEHRVVCRMERRIGGVRAGSAGFVYQLDSVGQAIVGGQPRRPWRLGHGFVSHGLLVTECLVSLTIAGPAAGFQLVDFQAEPACWQPYTGPAGDSLLKPDALAVTANGEFEDRWWLEVDNASEAPSRITRKATMYHQAYDLGATGPAPFPKVLWVATSEQRCRQLTQALLQLPADHQHLMAVCRLDQLPAAVAAGPAAWRLSGTPEGPA